MKAKTLWQPWASLIAYGYKTVETRGYAPPAELIGQRIAIHAAKRPMVHAEWSEGVYRAIEEIGVAELNDGDGFPYGAVVATAVLQCAHWVVAVSHAPVAVHINMGRGDCIHYEEWRLLVPADPYGDFSSRRWLWFLEDVKRVDPPAPATGRQGWWSWEPEGARQEGAI